MVRIAPAGRFFYSSASSTSGDELALSKCQNRSVYWLSAADDWRGNGRCPPRVNACLECCCRGSFYPWGYSLRDNRHNLASEEGGSAAVKRRDHDLTEAQVEWKTRLR